MTTTDQETQEKINAALDAALDDLDDSDAEEEYADAVQSPPTQATEPTPSPPSSQPISQVDDLVKQLLQQDSSNASPEDELLGHFLQAMQSQLGAEMQNLQAAAPPAATSPTPKTPRQSTVVAPSTGNTEADIDRTLNSIIENLSQQTKLKDVTKEADDDDDIDNLPGMDMLQQMMEQLGGGADATAGLDFNADALIDGMMEQLLSKELMYQPMKLVTEKFPSWLEENKDKVPPDEYQKRCQQYKCFQRLVHTYDTEPENSQLLMHLMQEVQEFGQPPMEIVQEIAPGLEFDADGVPKMDGMNGGPLPPFLAGGENECQIM